MFVLPVRILKRILDIPQNGVRKMFANNVDKMVM